MVALLIAAQLPAAAFPLAQATAAPTAAATDAVQLESIQMFSQTNGWGLTSNTAPSLGPNMRGFLEYLLHTQDSGKNWANVTPPLANNVVSAYDHSNNGLVGTYFLDNSHAWVVADQAVTGNQAAFPLQVFRTSDGGQSWQQAAKGISGIDVVAFSFIDAAHGWLLVVTAGYEDGGTAALYQTTDGGVTWQLVATDDANTNDGVGPIAGDADYTGMVFVSARSGWLTVSSPHYNDKLLHTTDAGKTWNDDTPAGVGDGCDLSGLRAYAPGAVMFLAYCATGDYAAYPQAYWYHSADGTPWQKTQIPTNIIVADSTPQFFMMNSTTGWMVGEDGDTGPLCCGTPYDQPTLFQTLNAGKTWTKIALLPDALRPPLDNHVPALNFDFVDQTTGWTIDLSGRLLTTQDSGKTWAALRPVFHVH